MDAPAIGEDRSSPATCDPSAPIPAAPSGVSRMLAGVDRVGAAAIAAGHYVLYLVGFLYLAVKMVWVGRHQGLRDVVRQVLLQVYFTGAQGIAPVAALALVVGALAIAEGLAALGPLSGAEGLGRLVTVVVLREIAPLLTGMIVIVRSVTAVAAELGVMRVQRETEALEAMGVSPILHLVTPRLLGGVLALAGLNVVFDVVSLTGGTLVARLLAPVPTGLFLRAALSAFAPADLLALVVKVGVGGIGIFLIACYHGMDVGGAPTEVPVAVARAALRAVVFLVTLHAAVSLLVLLARGPAALLGGVL